ncbi:hypothetical protein [Amycolatopsis sp. NBC_01480]|uniref:hypothetical protein n=1 Tax=Amycolatopsis sp. NBC_01480 TaxID=2903562 RepID=UPI002E2BECEB|nr:hypothetical protein [Amycolatopsis sp. NBC_01480]
MLTLLTLYRSLLRSALALLRSLLALVGSLLALVGSLLALVGSLLACLLAPGLAQLPPHTGLDDRSLSHATRRRRLHGFGIGIGIGIGDFDLRSPGLHLGLSRIRMRDLGRRIRDLGLRSIREPSLGHISIGDLSIRRIAIGDLDTRRLGIGDLDTRRLGIGDFGNRRAGLHIGVGRIGVRGFGRRIRGFGLRGVSHHKRLADQRFPVLRAGSPGDVPDPAWRPHVPNPSSDHRWWSDARLARVKTPYSA